ncbi:MAG: 3-phosphoserine/phosphohydroxythreonine transaminase [Planctomycetota bacterium]|jgi:phosphoserine aminotransferase|nr:3-phosphoserine/phosphohydroxythreonine transaminase [Planctomycetota bacterium]
MRVYNFGAGPAALPLPVLEKAQAEMLDFGGTGMSIMEMSHRSKTYQAVIDAAEAGIRRILGVPDNYAVLFLAGGASQQFAMVPLNLLGPGQVVNIIHTGAWAEKALTEAKIVGRARVIWDGKDSNYMTVPQPADWRETRAAAYVHLTSNETIGGVQFHEFPQTQAPLVADMSSDIMSRRLNVADFGLIYAGAQKNIGPSGLGLVIIRQDLLEICPDTVSKFFRYRTHAAEGSMYNTPNTWAVYIVKLICDWVEGLGGLEALEKRNDEKAAILYDALDASAFWKPCAEKPARSKMNVTWRLASEDLEAKFVKEATAAGLAMLKGHRSVGGLRASIYNACEKTGVLALTQFMRDFEKKNG